MPEHKEIERQFLIEHPPADLAPYAKERLIQGYVSVEPEVRVRSVSNSRFVLTIKSSDGLVRSEIEFPITREMFEALIAAEPSLTKTRYHLPVQGPDGNQLTIELDVYEGNLSGLITAEVEFRSMAAADAFTPPGWFGLEVTRDARWKCRNLATRGRPDMTEQRPAIRLNDILANANLNDNETAAIVDVIEEYQTPYDPDVTNRYVSANSIENGCGIIAEDIHALTVLAPSLDMTPVADEMRARLLQIAATAMSMVVDYFPAIEYLGADIEKANRMLEEKLAARPKGGKGTT